MSNILNVSDLRSLISGSRRVDIDNSPHDESATSRILSRIRTIDAPESVYVAVEDIRPVEAPQRDYLSFKQLKLNTLGEICFSDNGYLPSSELCRLDIRSISHIPDHYQNLINRKVDDIIFSMQRLNPNISRDKITGNDFIVLFKKLKLDLYRNFSFVDIRTNIHAGRVTLYISSLVEYEDSEYADSNYFLRVVKTEDVPYISERVLSIVTDYLAELDKPANELFTEEECEHFIEYFDECAAEINLEYRCDFESGIINLVICSLCDINDGLEDVMPAEQSISESSNRVLSLLRSSLIDDKSKVKEKEEDKKEKIIFGTMEDRVKYIFDSAQDFEEFKESPILKKLEEARSSSFLSREEVIAFAESDIEERIEKYKKDLLIHNRKPMRASIKNIRLLPQVQIITYF